MTSQSNMHNLTTLIKRYSLASFGIHPHSVRSIGRWLTLLNRLEAATSRLEDIATSVDSAGAATNGLAVGATTAPADSPEPTAPIPEPLPRSVEAFDEIIEGDIVDFVKASGKIGGLVEEQVRHLAVHKLVSDRRRQKQSKQHSKLSGPICLSPPKQRSLTHSHPS
jgi:hypothetical protein